LIETGLAKGRLFRDSARKPGAEKVDAALLSLKRAASPFSAQNRRYVSLEALRKAKKTSELGEE
jgi:hypothetical protein